MEVLGALGVLFVILVLAAIGKCAICRRTVGDDDVVYEETLARTMPDEYPAYKRFFDSQKESQCLRPFGR